MDTVRQITVIETTLARRGNGNSSHSPCRVITQYWTPEGALLAERDPVARVITPEHIEIILKMLRDRLGEKTVASISAQMTELLDSTP